MRRQPQPVDRCDDHTGVLKKFRCKVKSFEFPGGHAVAPPEVLLEAMQWIKTEQK